MTHQDYKSDLPMKIGAQHFHFRARWIIFLYSRHVGMKKSSEVLNKGKGIDQGSLDCNNNSITIFHIPPSLPLPTRPSLDYNLTTNDQVKSTDNCHLIVRIIWGNCGTQLIILLIN